MPLVSVVLVFLNEERFLKEAIASVRDQTLTDWELILVDDGSTDRSTSIARELAAEDARIRYADHPGHQNRGISASRNLGVAHSTAPYIAFLDADDVWVPDKLAEQVDLLKKTTDIAMVCGSLLYWYSWDPAATDADVVLLTGGTADRRFDPPEAALANYPLAREAGAGVDLLVRRSVFEAVGGFEDRFRGVYEDQAFLIKVFLRYPVYISSRAWIRYRQHENSCCARTTSRDHLRVRGVFLDWLQEYVEPLNDARVHAEVKRARREVRYRRLTAPVHGLYRRISGRVPAEFKQRVTRSPAARSIK
jgi:glycosyltransferase involved in cell wall biosynthesis